MISTNSIFNTTVTLIFILVVSVFLTNCSKDNPVNVDPEEVAGTFDFTNYEFIPDASAIQTANVLDTLVTANTNIRLIAGGQFILSYQFENGPESVLIGNFNVTDSNITLTVDGGNETRMASLLLHSPLEFTRISNTNRLSLSANRTVDLSAFSDQYDGIPPVAGRLEIELERRSTVQSFWE